MNRQRYMMAQKSARCQSCTDMSDNLPVMAYVPVQEFKELLDTETALRCGTLFSQLVKPLKTGGRC